MAVAYVPDYLRVIREQTAAANAARNAKNRSNIRATGATTGEANRFARMAPAGTTTKAPTPRITSRPTTVAAIMRAQGATTGEANRFANLPGAPSMAQLQQAGGATPGEAQRFANIAESVQPKPETTTTPVAPPPVAPPPVAPPSNGGPVTTTPTPPGPVQEIVPEPAPAPAPAPAPEAAPAPAAPKPTPYNVYDDPFYQQLLADAQSQFNLDRIGALAGTQYQQRPIERQLEERPAIAEAARRRLAGNYARRGMAGGRYGALTRAEAENNAREISLRTGLNEQIAELNRQFTSQYGAEGTDWLGTRRGYEAQQAAIAQALQNRLGGLTTVG